MTQRDERRGLDGVFEPDPGWATGALSVRSGHLDLGGQFEGGAEARARLWIDTVGTLDLDGWVDERGRLDLRCVVPIGLEVLDAELLLDVGRGPPRRVPLPSARIRHVEESLGAELLAPGGALKASLDQPPAEARAKHGAEVLVVGWVYSTGVRIRRVYCACRSGRFLMVRGAARPDVGEALPDEPESERAGFCGHVRAPADGAHLDLELFAELEDGTAVRFMSRRVHLSTPTAPATREPERVERGGWLERLGKRARALVAADPSEDSSRPPRVTPPRAASAAPEDDSERERLEAYERFRDVNRIRPPLRARLQRLANELEDAAPSLGLLLPLDGASTRQVLSLVRSLRRQLFGRWTLDLLDLGTSGPYLADRLLEDFGDDPRVRVHRAPGLPAAEAPARLVLGCEAQYVALLEPDLFLPEDGLLVVAERLSERACDVLYTDEDAVDAAGAHTAPRFKPPWNPALLLADDYLGALTFLSTASLAGIGGFDPRRGTAQVHDAVLRIAERDRPPRVEHVPVVASHRSFDGESAVLVASISAPPGTPVPLPRRTLERADAAVRAADTRSAIAEAIRRRGLQARVEPLRAGSALNRVVWSPKLLESQPVTMLIPTRDRVDLLRRCVAGLHATVPRDALRVVIIDDHSVEPESHAYFEQLATDPRYRVIKQKRARTAFNFARLINFGMEHVETPLALILNSDTEASRPGWLEDLVGWLSVADVGAVGARLLYDDGTIQHAGVIVGVHGGLADHLLHHLPAESDGYLGLSRLPRDAAAVTGACILTPSALYRRLGGLDEERFSVDYNDIDYCLRVLADGQRVIYTPGAELVHMGSASRGRHYEATEHQNFSTKYAGFVDPHLSPSFHPESPRLEIDLHRHVHAARVPPELDVWVVAARGATDPSSEVSDYVDGLVRARPRWRMRWVTDRPAPLGDDLLRWRDSIAQLARAQPGSCDVVVAHGFGAHWAVELARQLGRPVVWYIGEREGPRKCAQQLGAGPRLTEVVFRSLARATRVAFASIHSMEPYGPFAARDHHRALPIGASMRRLAAFRSVHTRDSLRARHGIGADEQVVLFGGDVTGASRPSAVLDSRWRARAYALRGDLGVALDGRGPSIPRLDLIGLGDTLIVRTLGREVYPRTLPEAMALGCMVIGPHGPGFGEVIGEEDQGMLFHPPFEASLFRNTLERSIRDPEWRRSMASRARTQASLLLDSARLVPRHACLIEEAVVAS